MCLCLGADLHVEVNTCECVCALMQVRVLVSAGNINSPLPCQCTHVCVCSGCVQNYKCQRQHTLGNLFRNRDSEDGSVNNGYKDLVMQTLRVEGIPKQHS